MSTEQRQLDCRVARAMGLITTTVSMGGRYPDEVIHIACPPDKPDVWKGDPWSHVTPHFSTDIAAAWTLVEHAISTWPQVTGQPAKYWQFVSLRDGRWTAQIREECASAPVILSYATEPTLAEAIVAAFLKVMEAS